MGVADTLAKGKVALLKSTLPAAPKAAVFCEIGSTLVLMLTP